MSDFSDATMEAYSVVVLLMAIVIVRAQSQPPPMNECPGPVEERTAAYWTFVHKLQPYPLGGAYKLVHRSKTMHSERSLNSIYFFLYKAREASYFRQHDAETLITLMHGSGVKVYVLEPKYGDLYTFHLSKRGRTTVYIKPNDIYAVEMRSSKQGRYSLLSLSFTPSVELENEEQVTSFSRSDLMVKYPHLSNILFKFTVDEIK